ncbi:MAG: hypothetical protein KF799_16270 [Bdellovibrionales bacterium]|nr:hypothetical protein [Bdellovibrionales bacterium]
MSDKLQLEAMVAATDLWVIPTPRYSRWFTHLDWYFNWQMCKGLAYGGLHLPAETYRVAEEYGVPVGAHKEGEGALLISCAGKVPAAKCLVLEGADSLREWLGSARDTAEKLQARDIRVFLPTGVSVKEAEKTWKKAAFDVHFSTDLESTP